MNHKHSKHDQGVRQKSVSTSRVLAWFHVINA